MLRKVLQVLKKNVKHVWIISKEKSDAGEIFCSICQLKHTMMTNLVQAFGAFYHLEKGAWMSQDQFLDFGEIQISEWMHKSFLK